MRGNLGGERSESKNGPETQRVILSRTLSDRLTEIADRQTDRQQTAHNALKMRVSPHSFQDSIFESCVHSVSLSVIKVNKACKRQAIVFMIR